MINALSVPKESRMTVTTLIDRRPTPGAPSPQAERAAHDVVFAAMVLALAKAVAVSVGDDELEGFLGTFGGLCDKMAAQTGVPAVAKLVTQKRGDLIKQLRDMHRGIGLDVGVSGALPHGYKGG